MYSPFVACNGVMPLLLRPPQNMAQINALCILHSAPCLGHVFGRRRDRVSDAMELLYRKTSKTSKQLYGNERGHHCTRTSACYAPLGDSALHYVVLSCLALYCCLHGWSFRKEIWGHERSGLSRPRWTDWSAPLLRWQVIVPPLKKGRACGHCGEGGCNRQRMNKLQLCDSCLQTLQRPCSPRRDGRSFGHSAIAGPAARASVFSIQQRLCPTNDDPFAVAAATLASSFIPFSPIAI